MIIEPKIRGFICTTAHPTGCQKNIEQQIHYIKQHPALNLPKRVLVIGASTGYGLASRIAAAFGANAETIGVFFERPSENNRCASAGWYNSAAFENAAHATGLYAKSINGDAFSDEIKQQTIELIKKDWSEVDLIIYSVASPRRIHPKTKEIFNSVLKPIAKTFSAKTVNAMTGDISTVTLEAATEQEINNTIAVMGGEDWTLWIDALEKAQVLAKGATTLAYSYIGPKLTYPIYREGTIGRAKEDLEKTAHELNQRLQKIGGHATVSVNKALVTQASAAIPVVPLYISLLYRVMKNKNLHEDCIEQIYRLFKDHMKQTQTLIKIDDWEMREDVQAEVAALWEKVSSENINEISDIENYRKDFNKLFGFGLAGVDYQQDVDPAVAIRSLA